MTSPILPRSSTLVRTFGPALVLGLSGDQTQHVLWRLQEGDEFRPAARAGGEPAVGAGNNYVVLVLIGTNNIGSGHLPGPAAEGVAAVVERVLTLATGARVLLSTVMSAFPAFPANWVHCMCV
jgi:hypothetical protein